MGVINKFFGRFKINQDPSVTTQVTAVIQSTSGSLALVPEGTGAIVASIPNGAITGGNARGTYSVDLQLNRNAATQVASGGWATVIGGFGNTASANASIAGGDACTASGLRAISFGQSNTASSNYSVVSGGQSNTASTNTHATVVGGQSNTASGLQSVVGGASCVASGQGSFAIGGANTANSAYGSAFGFGSNTSGNSAMSIGGYGLAYLEAQFSQGSGRFSSTGDAQNSRVTARRESALTSGATATLSLSGNGTTLLIIPNGNNRAWNVQIDTIAVVTTITGTADGVTVGDCYRETKQLLFKRIGGTSSIVGTVDTTAVKSDTSMSACAMTITAGASQEMALTFTAPTFTGGGSVTCRVVSKVSLVEVAY